MSPSYCIVTARPNDIQAVPAIELAAATLLRGHAPATVLSETTENAKLVAAQRQGRLWVALVQGKVVGAARVEMLSSGHPHLEEIDVLPAHGRQGIGTALMRAVCEWTCRQAHRQLTLTTFRHVAWNMPFYARIGFTEVLADALSPELVLIVREETRRGLAPQTRAVMVYRCPSR